MMYYSLRLKEELIEELRVLTAKKKQIEEQYRLAMTDITADASVIKAELELLKSLGKYSGNS